MNRFYTKNILIGLLVTYVVVYAMISVLENRGSPSLLEKVYENIGSTSVMMALVVGISTGALAWYVSKNKEEYFTHVDMEDK